MDPNEDSQENLIQKVEGTRFGDWLRSVGLNKTGVDIYWAVKLWLNDYKRTRTIGDISATFRTKNGKEWQRLDTMFGEITVVERLLDELCPNDVFLDIGANIGTHSCFALQVLTKGEVHAVEPHPHNERRLKENLKMNAASKKWYTEQIALLDSFGTMKLKSEGGAGIGTHYLTDKESVKAISVSTETGDKFVNDNGFQPDVVKIDVEGSEAKVLQGLSEALTNVRVVICEVHSTQTFASKSDTVESILNREGFDIELLSSNREGEYHLLAS